MSNATPTPPRTCAEQPAGGDIQSDSSSSEVGRDSPLADVTTTVAKDEAPGDCDGRPESKQKRKRTSPEDQMILEAEYKKNPKPNKTARAEIVKLVKLNAKEIQIWFQNRRQINRRKSRPLLPHEIVAFGLGGMAALSSDSASDSASGISLSSSQSMEEPQTDSKGEEEHSSQANNGNSQEKNVSPSQLHCEEHMPVMEVRNIEAPVESGLPSQASGNPASKTELSNSASDTSSASFIASDTMTRSFSSTPGYLANRWNAINSSLSTPASSQTAAAVTLINSALSQPSSCPRRIGSGYSSTPPLSQVRLSLSLDGKAELVSTDLSPPCAHPQRPSSSGSVVPRKRMKGLQRSRSALPFGPLRNSPNDSPFVPRLPSGRSRDARTWEFCCDTEARDELTTQAENESTGSAVAAINLLRSTSNSALKTNTNKRNVPSAKQNSSNHGKRPKLGRAMSSLAVLQTTGDASSKQSQNYPSNGKDSLYKSPSGDSDKENWVPNENGEHARRHPLPAGREKQSHQRRILGDNFTIPTYAVNFGGTKNRKRKSANSDVTVFENEENIDGVGDEIQKFMCGEISPSKKGDMDCVQGLLSLSQGNWR